MEREREMATCRNALPQLLRHAGKYVLIQGDAALDIFGGHEDTLREGYRRSGPRPFLVRQIRVVEPIHLVTRLVAGDARGAGTGTEPTVNPVDPV